MLASPVASAIASGRSFASDNNATACPEVLEALTRANRGHTVAYGSDSYTESATAKFREHFGAETDAYFVFTGTGSNVLALQAATQPYHAIVCTEAAHIETSECGAAEKRTGCKLVLVPAPDGKLTPERILPKLKGEGDVHHVQAKVISLAQVTEVGTVYSIAEVRAIADLAHSRGMWLHMDGARLSNAAAALGVTLKAASRDAGVDILSFGGTKNGLICGESVVFFERALAQDFEFVRMQSMQLASKMRYISVQFEALLTGDLWLKNARHANAMAKHLAEGLASVPGIELVQRVDANMLFARLPEKAALAAQKESFFYLTESVPDSRGRVVARWIASHDTTPEDVRDFLKLLRRSIA